MKALVAGSVHLDVIARPLTNSSHKDRKGPVSFEVGGTAWNLAFGLQRMGASVRVLTAWGPVAVSTLMANKLVESGVELMADEVPGMESAAFVGLLNNDGDLESAISWTPIDQVDFCDERITAALEGVDCAVLETNLKTSAMRAIAERAHAAGIPVFALGVSEDKVDKLAELAGVLTAVFMNNAEGERLMEVLQVVDPAEIASHLGASTLITRGSRGAVLYRTDGSRVKVPPPSIDYITSLLGVGDALSAGIIHGVCALGLDYPDAASRSYGYVAEIAQRRSCNGFSSNALNTMVSGALEDSLTGLLRRGSGAFENAFHRVESGCNALIVIDCDHFKRVNDTLGHDVGDDVLRRVSGIIRTGIRSMDVACRWGGDEFVVLLPSADGHAAELVAERIRAVAENTDLHGVTLSLGVTTTRRGEDIAQAVARADQAMYTAKHRGKNSVAVA